MTRDHIVPIAHGGDHGIYNIQPLCYDCNRIKRTSAGDYRTPSDMASIMEALYQVDCCGADYDTRCLYIPMRITDDSITHLPSPLPNPSTSTDPQR